MLDPYSEEVYFKHCPKHGSHGFWMTFTEEGKPDINTCLRCLHDLTLEHQEREKEK